ncbi:MAG: GGDEF domain-containing protein [Lachnospiraceae bacterium]|nr:GGDEF domain-containing protein [Lachnospiraceae bacterium]
MAKKLEEYTLEEITSYINSNLDALIMVDAEADVYRTLVRNGFFSDFIEETGSYNALIQKLWFHLKHEGGQETVSKDYQVFVPKFGKFTGKYSKRIKITENDTTHTVQMTMYPIEENIYMMILDELDSSEYMKEFLTNEKVTTIQNTYLFSMYVDLTKDSTSSISITEISDETVEASIKYSDWRMMIVNMIWPDDQDLFLERTEPEYLKTHILPGRTSSFDCLMQNLEGKFIWVKLIFSRAETNNTEEDFRYVFMVQDIHENSVQLMSTLKKYEELALKDTLTDVFNHGRIETEFNNAVEIAGRTDRRISIMMFDIDFFKSVNDKYGHAVGDMTLKHVAYLMKEYFQKKNVAYGRWGGEEFAAVCYDTDIEKAKEYAEELRKKVLGEEFKVAGKVTISVGVTEIKKDDDFRAAFDRMDKALYTAKSEGRNCVRVL